MGCTVELPEKKPSCLQNIKQHPDKPQNFWNKVSWSDETKMKIYDRDHKLCVWSRANKAY